MLLCPLDTIGVEEKLTYLYSLPDKQLILEAERIAANFKKWLSDNFILRAHQQAFIAGLDQAALKYYGEQCALCFRERLYISFIQSPRPNNSYDKWLEFINHLKIRTNMNGLMVVAGSVAFIVSYRE